MDIASLAVKIDSSAAKEGAVNLDKFAAAAARTEKINNSLTATSAKMRASVSQAAKAIDQQSNIVDLAGRRNGAFGQGLGQLSFQLNDIASGLAMGTSPFTILAQQGGQVFQVWQMNRTVFTDLKTAIMNLVTPGRLIVAGFAAAAGAAILLYNTLKESRSTEQVLEEHARLLSVIKSAYSDAKVAAGEFFQQSRDISLLQAQQSLLALQSQIQEFSRKAIKQVAVPTGGGLTDAPMPEGTMAMTSGLHIDENMRAFSQAIIDFNASVERGQPAVQAYRDELARIGLAAAASNPVIAAQAAKLLENSQAMGDLAHKVGQAEAMMRMMNGTATDSDRKMLGLSVSTQAATNSYETLIQRTRDRTAEMNLEAQMAGKAEVAVMRLRMAHEFARAARQAGVIIGATQAANENKAIDENVAAYRNLTAAKIAAEIKFDRDTIFMSHEDIQIARTLLGMFDNDIPVAMGSSQAAAMRLTNTMRDFSDIGRNGLREFSANMRASQNATEAFGNSLMSVLDRAIAKLSDMAADNLWNLAFGGRGGGFNIFSLLGLGGGGPVSGMDMEFRVPGLAYGTNNWRGGMTWVGERGPEIVNLPQGSQVIPNDVAMGGGSPTINIFPVAGTTFDKKENPDGSIELVGRMIDKKIAAYDEVSLPRRVHKIIADPRAL